MKAHILTAMAAMLAGSLLAWGQAAAEDQPGKGVQVQPIWNGILEDMFQTQVPMILLEKLGYEVKEPLQLEISPAHLAVGQGDGDFFAQHWVPTHNAFFEQSGGAEKLVKLGPLYNEGVQGYQIDKKTADEYKIKEITDLKQPEIRKLFDVDGDGLADLTGCNPGWGCERAIEHHLDAYGLRDSIRHNQGAYFALMADTMTRFKEGKPVLYYTWCPLWVCQVLKPGTDVVWLSVPFTALPSGEDATKVSTVLPGTDINVGFSVNESFILANKEFATKNPSARTLLDQVRLSAAEISAENLLLHEGQNSLEAIRRHAEEWIAANPQKVDAWLSAARNAAK